MNQEMTKIEEAWLEYQHNLLSYIRSKVEKPEDAEDILNDVFAKLIKITNEDAIPDNVSSWLYHVTKNGIVDYYRARKRFDPLPGDLSEESEDTDTMKELSKCMLPMIQALPGRYQQPLMMSLIEGKKYKEIAIELGLSVSAVKSRILRGREKLYKSLVSCCTIYRNDAGETVNFEQNLDGFCSNCED